MISAGVTLSVGAMAEWLCSGLQIRVARFDSGLRLQHLHVRVVPRVMIQSHFSVGLNSDAL